MTLLVLDNVTKRVREGRSEKTVLSGVSLEVHAGELIAVCGTRRSGRTTLLQVASGLLFADEGRVLFAGRDLSGGVRLGREIAWAEPQFDPALGRTVAEQVAFPLLTDRPRAQAIRAAKDMLTQIDAADLADLKPVQCHDDELLLASIARAMVLAPRMLVLDEPVTGLDVGRTERLMELLRRFADSGTAVLISEERAQIGVDRTLTIHEGRIRGNVAPPAATVVPLRGVS